MENVTCALEGFGEQLMRFCETHVEEQHKALGDLVRKAGSKTASELRDSPLTPALTGEYAAGWAASSEEDRDGWVESTVHNKTRWQLTHLLEKGHQKFIYGHNTGERVPAYPHIEPAYAVGAQILEQATVDN